MLTIDLRTICRGLESLFLLKSIPFSATESKLPCAQLRRWFSLRSEPALHIVYSFVPSPKVPVHILCLGNIVNHVFEDLRKMKAPTGTQIELGPAVLVIGLGTHTLLFITFLLV
jgi:hypothetical protein